MGTVCITYLNNNRKAEGLNEELKPFSSIIRSFQLKRNWVASHISRVEITIETEGNGCHATVLQVQELQLNLIPLQYNVPKVCLQEVLDVWNWLVWARLQGKPKYQVGPLPAYTL